MKIQCSNIVVEHEVVDVPEVCPGCGADLTVIHRLKVWDYQDVGFYAKLDGQALNNVEYGENLGIVGESFFGPIDVRCAQCDYAFFENKLVWKEPKTELEKDIHEVVQEEDARCRWNGSG